MARWEWIGGKDGNWTGNNEMFLESKPEKPATSGGDLWETVEGFLLSLYRQLHYLC